MFHTRSVRLPPNACSTQQELRSPIGRIERVSFYLPLALVESRRQNPVVVDVLDVVAIIQHAHEFLKHGHII